MYKKYLEIIFVLLILSFFLFPHSFPWFPCRSNQFFSSRIGFNVPHPLVIEAPNEFTVFLIVGPGITIPIFSLIFNFSPYVKLVDFRISLFKSS